MNIFKHFAKRFWGISVLKQYKLGTKFGNIYILQLMITTSFNVILLDVNFDKFIFRLYIFFIYSIPAKFLKDQISITMSLINYLNFQFLYSKIMHKKLSYIIRIVNNIRLT